MAIKTQLEHDYIAQQTKSIEEKTIHMQVHCVRCKKIAAIDLDISKLLQAQQLLFNPKWERIFRAGAEESYFAYQVERFACIYMEKLSDLLSLSPLTYFRANRRLLAHDEPGPFHPN